MPKRPLEKIKPVYLCGFMGCGKSYYGRKANKLLGCKYIDLDDYITEKEGVSIPEIFTEKGEDYFRMLEYRSLTELKGAYLISLGGGVLTNINCSEYAAKNANVIFLDTDFDICFERIKDDPNRPNAFGKSKDSLYELYLSRINIYRKSAVYILKEENEILSCIGKLLEIKDKFTT